MSQSYVIRVSASVQETLNAKDKPCFKCVQGEQVRLGYAKS